MDENAYPTASASGRGGPQAPPAARPWSRVDAALLALAGASLIAGCVLTSRKKFFWSDEVVSWTLVTDRSLRHMVGALAQGADAAPPLFYIITRLWWHTFGSGELALRLGSCIGFLAAMTLMWAIVRRAYGTWPAAVASVTMFAGSQLVVYQIAEMRFYGLLTALVAFAVYLYTRAVWTRQYTRRLFALTAATHAALLYTHLFGALYSVAILTAWIVFDRLQRRPWHTGYFSVVVAWLAFTPWLPTLQRLGELAKPRSWMPVPSLHNLIAAYGFSVRYFPLIAAAIVTLGTIASLFAQHGAARQRPLPTTLWRQNAAAVVAGAVVVVAALWSVPPNPLTAGAIRDALTGADGLPVLALLVVVLSHQLANRRPPSAITTEPRPAVMDESLLVVGCALLAVPTGVYVLSHHGPSVFHGRYLIPASLGLIPIVGHFAWWCMGAPTRLTIDRVTGRIPSAILGTAWTGLIVLIVARPVWVTRNLPTQLRPGSDIEGVVPPGTTVVVESAVDFLPLRHYQQRSDITYAFPMDSTAAMDPHSYPGAIGEYKGFGVWRRLGLLSAAASSGSQVPCAGRPFVVLHSGLYSWYADRIANDSVFDVRVLGRSPSTWEKGTILLIQARASLVPATCQRS